MCFDTIIENTKFIRKSSMRKIKYFIAAYFIATSIFAHNLYYFFINEDDNYYTISENPIWQSFIFIFRLGLIAGVFGFVLGSFIKKINLLNKIVYVLIYVLIELLFSGKVSMYDNNILPKQFEINNGIFFENFFSQFLTSISSYEIIITLIIMFISAFYFINITTKSTSEINHNTEDSTSEVFSSIGFALFGIFIFFKIFGKKLFEIFFSIPKIEWSVKWIIQSSNISFFISFILISIIWLLMLRLFYAIKERSSKNKLTKKLVPIIYTIYIFVTVIWLICLFVFFIKLL